MIETLSQEYPIREMCAALEVSRSGYYAWRQSRGSKREPRRTGKSVRIERSRDLVTWEFAGPVPIPASGQALIAPAATSESRLFYRTMRMP